MANINNINGQRHLMAALQWRNGGWHEKRNMKAGNIGWRKRKSVSINVGNRGVITRWLMNVAMQIN